MNKAAANNSEAPLPDFYKSARIIADAASDAIITIDEQSTMLFVNRAAERIFGYSQAEMIGQSLTMLMPDYLRDVHRAGFQRYLNSGERHISWKAVALRGRHKNGREIPLELSFGEFSENGRRFFTGIARDISERRRLERSLAVQFQVARILAESDSLTTAAPALLQAISESLGWELGQLWSVDREAGTMRWLAAWRVPSLKMAEFEEASRKRTYSRGEGLPGRIWASGAPDWVSDVATDANFPRGALAAKAGLRSAFGFPILLGDEVSGVMEFFSRESQPPDQALLDMMVGLGSQIGQFDKRKWAEAEGTRIFDREQETRHEVEAAIDRIKRVQNVTDVALAHLALDELLAELLNRIRDAMSVDTVAILMLESDGKELMAWAAKGLEEEVELGVHIPMGSGFAGRIAAEKAPVRIDDLESSEVLNPLLKEKRIRSLLGVPLLVEGRVIGVIHVGKFKRYHFTEDDTRLLQLVADRIALAIENARLFEEERSARREAEAASLAKDEFLTTISHELRTPLTPVIGWVHMIRSGILPLNEMEHGLTIIEKNSHALKRLINDLLDMSAILTGKMRMEESPVHLEAVLREAIETVRPLALARDINLDLKVREWQDETVIGDRARLTQAFWNLLHNAVKFSAPGGQVRVDCEASGREAVVRIEDSGQGIGPDFLPFVFERFRQADGSKTRAHGGLGLGLALVKSFVEAHKGTVKAESEGRGQGSRFTVRLPLQESVREAAAPQIRKVKVRAEPEGAHLLIIEDDPDTLEILQATFELRGFRVTTCESAANALEIAPEDSVDLIISDIGMPGMDGFEMMRRLRRLPDLQKVPAIALTGYASQKDVEATLAAGFNAHVSKPVDPGELTTLIDRLLLEASGARNAS